MTEIEKIGSETKALRQVATWRREQENEDLQWTIIWELHSNGSEEVYDACIEMCSSDFSADREVAADVLSRLGSRDNWPDGLYKDQRIAAIGKLLSDKNDNVVAAACAAFGHLDARDVILSHLHLADHRSNSVRSRMALCLGYCSDSPAAIATLIKLSTDEDTDTRNWATFGLGTQCEVDTDEIRSALFRRIEDDDEETRNEAILGLAKRKVEGVLPALLRELGEDIDYLSPLAIEAAGELRSAQLLEPLRKLARCPDSMHDHILDAIALVEAATTANN